MPKKSKTLLDHANELATDLAEKIGPQVESAVESAREKAGPVLAEAREKAGHASTDARDRIATEVIPVIVAALAAAGEATEDVRGETRKRGKATVAALKGEVEAPKKRKKTHRFRNFLLLLGLGGVAAFVAKKLSNRPSSTTWESTYTTSPAPAAPAGAHRAEGAEGADDQGGASPDVAAADAASEPHAATTPDNPAETIDVKKN